MRAIFWHEIYIKMAEGYFAYDDTYHDYEIDHDDDDDVQETQNTTQPFNPGQASTPYHGGEQIQMQTMQHEQSGLPSYEETSFGGDQRPLLGDFLSPEEKKSRVEKAIDFIKKSFPKADFRKIDPIALSKKGTNSEIVSLGPKGGETKIFKQDGSGFLRSFTDKFSKSLGPSAEQIIAEDRDTIQEQSQRLAEAEKQQREAETIAAATKRRITRDGKSEAANRED